jgi:hypothetical protein
MTAAWQKEGDCAGCWAPTILIPIRVEMFTCGLIWKVESWMYHSQHRLARHGDQKHSATQMLQPRAGWWQECRNSASGDPQKNSHRSWSRIQLCVPRPFRQKWSGFKYQTTSMAKILTGHYWSSGKGTGFGVRPTWVWNQCHCLWALQTRTHPLPSLRLCSPCHKMGKGWYS